MGTLPRLEVQFAAGSILDAQSIHQHLSRIYEIGYVGLYDCGTHTTAYIQTASKSVRMTIGKVHRICDQIGDAATPKRFSHRQGSLIDEVGFFRLRGPKKYTKKVLRNKEGVEIKNAQQQTARDEEEDENDCESTEPSVHQADPVFVPVYSGFNRDWKIVSWNRFTRDFKRGSSLKFRSEVLDRQNHNCNYCGCPVQFGEYSNADMDHVIPLHAGGVNALHNVQVLCTPDHRKKTALEGKRAQGTLSAELDCPTFASEEK